MGSNCYVGFSRSTCPYICGNCKFLTDRDSCSFSFIMLYCCFKEFIINVPEVTVYPVSRLVNSFKNPKPSLTAIGRKSSTKNLSLLLYYELNNTFACLDGQVRMFTTMDYYFHCHFLSSLLCSIHLGDLLLSDISGCYSNSTSIC